jgi:hypothetical protein
MRKYPYAFHIALDGNGINGLEGEAGVCVFLFDPRDDAYAYKIKYYNGLAGGHALNVNPGRTCAFLGSTSQQLLLYDPKNLEELGRVSTLRFEPNDTTVRGSTHAVWLDDRHFITAIGDYFYRFDAHDLSRGERLGPHNLKLAHQMKLSHSGKYICYGSMDNPRYEREGAAREVGVWDMSTGEATRIPMPTTCWHVADHPRRDLFYSVSFQVQPTDHGDYHDWAMAFFKEYAYEIDPAEKEVLRHWTCSRETPAHINSDLTMSDSELIFCTGGSQTIIFIDLENFADFRMVDEKPDLAANLGHLRQIGTQVYDSFARGNFFTQSRHFFGAMRVSRFTLMDSVHACQLSADQSLLFTANRGLNHITIYDYPSLELRLRVPMPDLQEYLPRRSRLADPRLGFHHAVLLNPLAGEPGS